MKKLFSPFLLPILVFIAVTFSSCEAIAGIFKAGVWVGITVVIIIVALILWLVNRARK